MIQSYNNTVFVNQTNSLRRPSKSLRGKTGKKQSRARATIQNTKINMIKKSLHLNSILSYWIVHFFLLLPFGLQRCLFESAHNNSCQYKHTICLISQYQFESLKQCSRYRKISHFPNHLTVSILFLFVLKAKVIGYSKRVWEKTKMWA